MGILDPRVASAAEFDVICATTSIAPGRHDPFQGSRRNPVRNLFANIGQLDSRTGFASAPRRPKTREIRERTVDRPSRRRQQAVANSVPNTQPIFTQFVEPHSSSFSRYETPSCIWPRSPVRESWTPGACPSSHASIHSGLRRIARRPPTRACRSSRRSHAG